MCRTSIYEARNNFSALVKCAEEGEVVELTRYDKPVAVMMSYSEYEERKAGKVDWLTKWRKEHEGELDDLGFDFTEIFYTFATPILRRDRIFLTILRSRQWKHKATKLYRLTKRL